MLRVIDTKESLAEENMRLDSELLADLKPDDNPIIHLYGWSNKSATFGYFIKPEKYLNLAKAQELGLDLARRPTGGGIVFHIWDMAFSFLMPSKSKYCFENALDNYQFVNSLVLNALQALLKLEDSEMIKEDFEASSNGINFCMARPTKYDVVINNKKLIGASQRRKKEGYLHQGTIALALPDEGFLRKIILDEEVLKSILEHSYGLFEMKEIREARADLSLKLIQSFKNALAF